MASGIPVKSKIGKTELLKISPFKEVIKPTVPHKHAGYFELIILNDGAGIHQIDDQSYEVTPPVIFFLKPGQTHCWDFTRIPKGYVILFKEELLTADQLAIIYNLNMVMHLVNDEAYLQLLKLFCDEYRRTEADIQILTGYLRLLIQKTAIPAQQIDKPTVSALYYRFKSLLNSSEPGLKNVHDYAIELGTTPQQLNTVCRKAAGKTPSMMLNERLLQECKTLLSATEQTIKEIAHLLHFSDTSHFVKFFKSSTNLTPGAYRELIVAKR